MSYLHRMKTFLFLIVVAFCLPQLSSGQKAFTHADTLRGSITPERAWWDVQRYDVKVTPDFNSKTIVGENKMTYFVTKDNNNTWHGYPIDPVTDPIPDEIIQKWSKTIGVKLAQRINKGKIDI